MHAQAVDDLLRPITEHFRKFAIHITESHVLVDRENTDHGIAGHALEHGAGASQRSLLALHRAHQVSDLLPALVQRLRQFADFIAGTVQGTYTIVALRQFTAVSGQPLQRSDELSAD